jgi:hypothetical protein
LVEGLVEPRSVVAIIIAPPVAIAPFSRDHSFKKTDADFRSYSIIRDFPDLAR